MIDLSQVQSADVYDRADSEIQEKIYRVCLSDMTLGESRSAKPMVTCEFVISEGPAKGKRFKNWYVLGSDKGMAVFKGFLEAAAGADVGSFGQSDVPRYVGKELLMGIGLEEDGRFLNPRPVCVAPLSQSEKIKEKFEKSLAAFKRSLASKQVSIPKEINF